MTKIARTTLICLAGAALLAGCSSDHKKDDAKAKKDPAVTGALGDQIMVDPQLAGQGGAVEAGGTTVDIPPEQRSPEAIAAAMQDAAKKAGGTLDTLPEPAAGGSSPLMADAATAAQVAAASKAASTDCASKVKYAMDWATHLPAPLAVYPRAAVQEAAGVDGGGCALAVVNFVTPVSVRDVLSYYYTSARKAGYSAGLRMDGHDQVLGGKNGGKAYVVAARKLGNGLTDVDLISSGK